MDPTVSFILLCLWATIAVSTLVKSDGGIKYREFEEPLDHPFLKEIEDFLNNHPVRGRNKRTLKRRCGNVLIMDILRVCDGCVGSPTEKRSLIQSKGWYK